MFQNCICHTYQCNLTLIENTVIFGEAIYYGKITLTKKVLFYYLQTVE